MSRKAELVELITGCVRAVAEEEDISLDGDFAADSVLFGQEGYFDSLGLVSLVMVVEEAIGERFGHGITLADQRAMSQSTSPFRSVDSLASYAETLIREAE